MGTEQGQRRTNNSFLLAQIGAHAAARFAERIAAVDLTRAQAGLLRLIAWQPGQSQQAIAGQLGTPASRLVLLVDALEKGGLVERRRNPDDRRHHALYLTEDGGRFMGRLGEIGTAHEEDICAALDPDDRARLNELLVKVATQQGLVAGVHPGYRSAGPATRAEQTG